MRKIGVSHLHAQFTSVNCYHMRSTCLQSTKYFAICYSRCRHRRSNNRWSIATYLQKYSILFSYPPCDTPPVVTTVAAVEVYEFWGHRPFYFISVSGMFFWDIVTPLPVAALDVLSHGLYFSVFGSALHIKKLYLFRL